MKLAFGVLIFIWLLCGVIGAWRAGELDARHWQTIALGPFSLVDAFNENPVKVPGPG